MQSGRTTVVPARVLALVVLLAAALIAPADAQGRRGRRAQQPQRPRDNALRAGDPAPDFDLKEQKSDARVQLSSFKDRMPVALVFGSYT